MYYIIIYEFIYMYLVFIYYSTNKYMYIANTHFNTLFYGF